jgi:hypothetical protein
MSLILLDRDGNVVHEMVEFEPPDTVMADDRLFDYEDRDGDDYIYRERPL